MGYPKYMSEQEFGIKVSKRGYNIDGSEGSPYASRRVDAHILYSLAIPYLMGAYVTVQRYQQEASQLRVTPVRSSQACLHEVSTLFEDLGTISKYSSMCGDSHKNNKLWVDIRNHIRHDFREEFDKEDRKLKNARAVELGLPVEIQVDIGFSESAIRVGAVTIMLKDINDYIHWAAVLFNKVMNEAREKGYIKESEWHPDILNS